MASEGDGTRTAHLQSLELSSLPECPLVPMGFRPTEVERSVTPVTSTPLSPLLLEDRNAGLRSAGRLSSSLRCPTISDSLIILA